MTARRAVLEHVAELVVGAGATRVGIDGVDAAGKTILADELATALEQRARPTVRVSIDGFHRPREARYRRGRSSPAGYWLDSYDYPKFSEAVLDSFAPGGDRTYRRAVFDVASDRPVDVRREAAPVGSILVVDGIFLHRDELVDAWDFSVFLRADFAVTFARMAARDGFPADPAAASNHRYLAGQRIYLEACAPERRADVVIDNSDPAEPRVVWPDQSGSQGTDS